MLAVAGANARSCRRCGKLFTSKPKAHGQRFCTKECRWRFNFKNVYYPKQRRKKPRYLLRRCGNCLYPFSIDTRGRGRRTHTKYCTERCAKNARRRRRYWRKKGITSSGHVRRFYYRGDPGPESTASAREIAI